MTVYAITDTKKWRPGIVPTYLQTTRRYHHEIFTGARYSHKLGGVRKWLHFDALRRAGGDLTSLAFWFLRLPVNSYPNQLVPKPTRTQSQLVPKKSRHLYYTFWQQTK